MKYFNAKNVIPMMMAGCVVFSSMPVAVMAEEAEVFEDSLGNSFTVDAAEHVAVCSGSLAQAWQLAGGDLYAVTEDYWDDEENLDGEILSLGSLKTPNLEVIVNSETDFIILSANVKDQVAMQDQLEKAGITVAYYDVNTFDEYADMMETFTAITGNEEAYEQYVTAVGDEIEKQLERADDSTPQVLLLRSFSTGVSAKGSDNLAGEMLKDLGCVNIADTDDVIVDNLSLEAILMADPEYIFVTYMGDEEAAEAYLEESLTSDPAWASLSAVQNDKFYILDKELFQNKPNERWAESYTVLADILYGE